MTIDTSDPRLPTAEDEGRFWALIESAWASMDPAVRDARRALASRAPGADADRSLVEIVEAALGGFLNALRDHSLELSSAELTDLDRVLERKLYDLDRSDVHAVTGGSDDGFLYARGFVIALGGDVYTAVARDPGMAVPDGECGAMCYFFARLHRERFGDHPDTGARISRESFSNPAGWSQ